MKVIIAIASLLLSSITIVHTQINELPEEGSILTYAESGMFYGYNNRQIVFSGNETFNDTTYTVFTNGSGATLGYLRSQDNKWFARNTNHSEFSQTEFLIYNWGAEEGDIFSVGYPRYNSDDEIVVHEVHIDSVNIIADNQGVERKLFYYKNVSFMGETVNGVWLEGIGSINHSPFSAPAGISQLKESFYSLVCADINGNLVYEKPLIHSSILYMDCGWTTVAVDEIYRSIKVYPNPTSEILYIKLESPSSFISISNSLGQIKKTLKTTKSDIEIDISDLKTGNYFVQFTNNKRIHHIRFIKN